MTCKSRFRQTLTADQEQGLYEAVHKARESSNTVKVNKDALFALLVDYGRALDVIPDGYEDALGRLGP